VASSRPRPFHHHHAARTRDAALRRLSVLNRLTAVGAVGLALGFTAMAARATPPRHSATQVTTPAPAHRSAAAGQGDDHAGRHRSHRRPAGGDDAPAQQSAAPAQAAAPVPAPAPAPTPQPPVVISGGS
jgi:hypothetical protein